MLAAVFVSAIAATVAVAAPVAQRDQPAGYATGYLEEYDVYHARYTALNCSAQHDTTFFDDCCHPLLANENVADHRKAYCTADATLSSSAAAAWATATSTGSDDAASDFSAATSSVEAVLATATVAKVYAEPTTTSTKAAKTSTSAAPVETQSSGGGGYSQSGGFATFFYQGGNPGACGVVHGDYDKVIAIDSAWWSTGGDASEYCGKWINIKNTNNGKTVTAMVADECPTCTNGNSLDLSVGAFTAIASEGDGMVPIEWSFA